MSVGARENVMAQPLTRLNPPALSDASRLGYSQITVMEPGRLAFVSGQVGAPPGGGDVPEGLAAQAELVSPRTRRPPWPPSTRRRRTWSWRGSTWST